MRDIIIVCECPLCGCINEVSVNAEDYAEWKYGDKYIQDAMPYLTPNEREYLMSGICEDCWGDEDEYDEPEDIDSDEGFDPYMGEWTGDC